MFHLCYFLSMQCKYWYYLLNIYFFSTYNLLCTFLIYISLLHFDFIKLYISISFFSQYLSCSLQGSAKISIIYGYMFCSFRIVKADIVSNPNAPPNIKNTYPLLIKLVISLYNISSIFITFFLFYFSMSCKTTCFFSHNFSSFSKK